MHRAFLKAHYSRKEDFMADHLQGHHPGYTSQCSNLDTTRTRIIFLKPELLLNKVSLKRANINTTTCVCLQTARKTSKRAKEQQTGPVRHKQVSKFRMCKYLLLFQDTLVSFTVSNKAH